jgi:mRNA interferase MazF
VVLAEAGRGDWILCQVTSNPYGDPRAVPLTASSFTSGSLRAESYARPGKLFTASRDLMVAELAILNADARQQVVDARGRDLASGRATLTEHIPRASNMPLDPTGQPSRLRLGRLPAGQRRRWAA